MPNKYPGKSEFHGDDNLPTAVTREPHILTTDEELRLIHQVGPGDRTDTPRPEAWFNGLDPDFQGEQPTMNEYDAG